MRPSRKSLRHGEMRLAHDLSRSDWLRVAVDFSPRTGRGTELASRSDALSRWPPPMRSTVASRLDQSGIGFVRGLNSTATIAASFREELNRSDIFVFAICPFAT